MTAKPKQKGLKLQTAVATKAKAQRMVARLQQQYALGQAAMAAQTKGLSIAQFASEHAYSEHTMRKFRTFARSFSQADLNELCQGRRPNGLPLHWGYVPILMAIESKHGKATRKHFQQLVIEKGWTVPRLYHEVRTELGVNGHGRTPQLPQKGKDELENLREELGILQRRCEKLAEASKKTRDKEVSSKSGRLIRALVEAQKILGH